MQGITVLQQDTKGQNAESQEQKDLTLQLVRGILNERCNSLFFMPKFLDAINGGNGGDMS